MTGPHEAPKRNHASASRTVKCSAGQAKQRMQVFVDYCKRKDAPSEVARWRWRVRSSSQSSCRAARAESGDEVQAVRERAWHPADAGVPSPTQNPTCPSGVPRHPALATTSGAAPSLYGASAVAGGACGEATAPRIAAATVARD